MAQSGDGSKDLRKVHLWQIQGVRDVVVVAAVIFLVWVGYAMRTVTVPLLVAFGLAYLVEPLVKVLTKDGRMRRSMAVTLILVVAGGSVTVGLALAAPVVWTQTTSLVEELKTKRFQQLLDSAEKTVPQAWREPVSKVTQWLRELTNPPGSAKAPAGPAPAGAGESPGGAAPASAPAAPPVLPTNGSQVPGADAGGAANGSGSADPAAVKGALESEDEHVRKIVAEQVSAELAARGISTGAPHTDVPFASLLGSGVQQVLSKVIDVITLLFLAFLVPFYFYFFSVSFPDAVAFLRGLLPQGRSERIIHLAREMDRAVSGFVRGRIVIAFLMGVMVAIGWKVCGVPYAIALGLAAGVLSIVPYLGFVAVPVAIGMLLLDQFSLPAAARMEWYWILAGPLGVMVIVQSIEGYLLTPLIAGKITDLGPVSIFVAVLAGASLAGVYGMLLSIPAAACLKIWWREVLLPRIKDWSAGRKSDPLPLDSE